jgi:ABC-type multidrug transport system fused ATPase/permease subunit
MGIAPLVVGVPLIAAAALAMGLLHPAFVLALLAPLAVLTLALCTLTRPTFERTRALRRTRGQLSAYIADSILATTSIRAGGGVVREINRIDRLSRSMVEAAIRRARLAGALRGAGAASSGLAIASAVGVGLALNLPVSTIAAALTMFGFLATPMNDIGRSAEFRQAYRAAVRIIGPAMQPPPEAEVPATPPTSSRVRSPAAEESARGVVAADMTSLDGNALPTLVAEPGDRVVVDLGDRRDTSSLLARFAGLEPLDGSINIAGKQLRGASHGRLRRLVGYAAQGLMLGRGTIVNAVRYRATDAPDAVVDDLLGAVGLWPRVRDLPKGAETVLRHGGEPLTIQERALVQLARALLNTPPLLVLDHLDADLGIAGRETLCRLLTAYPGTVLIAGDHAAEVVTPTHVWRRDAVLRPGRIGHLQTGESVPQPPPGGVRQAGMR